MLRKLGRLTARIGIPVRTISNLLPRKAEFATFWQGPIDPLTYTCLASFARHRLTLRLYSYGWPEVPPGVELADARQIVADESLVNRFLVDGKPSLAKFSNYFRYMVIKRTGLCWVDADMLCLRRPDFLGETVLFGRQGVAVGPWEYNGAVLKLPRNDAMLEALLERATDAVDKDRRWGTTGPLLITELAHAHQITHLAKPREVFYPLKPKEFWKPLLPGYRQQTLKAVENATFLHLWNEMLGSAGYDKQAAPVEGSYLHDMCRQLGTLERFERTYERQELRDLLGDRLAGETTRKQAL